MFPIFLNYKKTLRELHTQDPENRTNPLVRALSNPDPP